MYEYETCIDGVSFEAAHYTHVRGKRVLHGHTFKVKVCLRGEGRDYVIDFLTLRDVINTIVKDLNYSLLIPKDHQGKVRLEAPVKVVINEYVIDGEPTAENIARHICLKLIHSLRARNININNVYEVLVEVWEGSSFHGGYSIKIKNSSVID